MELPPPVTKPQIHEGTSIECNSNQPLRGPPSHDECLRSLAFPEMNHRSNDIESAARGTCEWLLKHEMFKSWAAREQGLFWIKGKPGSGKSTLLRYALDNFRQVPSYVNEGLVLSFFFHGRGSELQKTPLGFFRSLLHQILSQVPYALLDLATSFQNWYDTIKSSDQKYEWRLSELQRFFESSLPNVLKSRPIWLFVDALDECGEENAASIVQNFESWLQIPSLIPLRFHICFTCRHYPILDTVASELSLEHENKQDITTYVRDRLFVSRELKASNIPNLVTERAKGVFMWARLVVDRILARERSRIGLKVIEKEIYAIPPDLSKLYNKMISSMDEKPASLRLFQCICFALRPLTLDELRWAMIVDLSCQQRSLQDYESMEEYIGDSVRMEGRIKALSHGLAEISESPNIQVVQLIHQSVQDFLLEKGLLALHDEDLAVADINLGSSIAGCAHYELARTCIRYMAIKEIAQSTKKMIFFSPRLHPRIFSRFPLLKYAAKSWIEHVKQSEARNVSQEDLLSYLEWPSEKLVRLWLRVYHVIDPHPPPLDSCLIHIVSQYQMIGLLRSILQRVDQVGANMDAKNRVGRTPLSYAAESGNIPIVKLLIERDDIEADSKDNVKRTPLLYAARYGHEDIVKLLIAQGDFQADLKDDWGMTPLAYALSSGYEGIVKLLIPDSKDNWYRTNLLYQVRYTHERILAAESPQNA